MRVYVRVSIHHVSDLAPLFFSRFLSSGAPPSRRIALRFLSSGLRRACRSRVISFLSFSPLSLFSLSFSF